jgi:hypothetical protein
MVGQDELKKHLAPLADPGRMGMDNHALATGVMQEACRFLAPSTSTTQMRQEPISCTPFL